MARDWKIFISSIYFVLGFAVVFSLLGVLLQGILSSVSYQVQTWLSRIGGVIIIIFGILLLDIIKLGWLNRDYKFQVKHKFHSMHLTSFIFGAAFAVGWTPCVGPVLGAVLTLAITKPATAFFLMLAYSLGLGVPFLLVGLFTNEAQRAIKKAGKWLTVLKYIFGVILIIVGILVFTNTLSILANHTVVAQFFASFDARFDFGTSINLGIAFLAGLVSFLSPCVLPLIPAFLAYLASIGVNHAEKNNKPN